MKNIDPEFLDGLRERVAGLIGTHKGAIAEAARRTGLPVNNISRMLNGKNEPGAFLAAQFARGMGVSLDWLLTGRGEGPSTKNERTAPADTVRISVLDVQAAAGGGSFNDRALEVEAIDWPRAFLRKVRANPRTTDSLRAAGDSMAPTIETGAFLLVDRSQNDLPAPRNGRPRMPEIFVFVQGKTLRVKRIERIDDNWLALISDNYAMHPPEIVKLGAITIIGKVVWWDNRL